LRLEDEVEKVTECSPERANAMLAWLLRAAEYKPALFSGFEAEFSNGRLLLDIRGEIRDLYQRWEFGIRDSVSRTYLRDGGRPIQARFCLSGCHTSRPCRRTN